MPESIAVIGLGCRYPDADSPRELWENVLAQHRSFRRIPPERLPLADYHHTDPTAPDKFYSPYAAVLADYAFDRLRHRVSGATFRAVDTTHWLAVDVAERALADAGFAALAVDPDRVGVVVGNTLTGEFSRTAALRLRWPYVRGRVDAVLRRGGWAPDTRAELLSELEIEYKAPFEPIGEESLAGGLSNTIAGRVCNTFDLHGGAWTVDAACASSLLAVINAAETLTRGDVDVMLAGGVDLSLDPFELVGFAKVGALAPRLMRVYDQDSEGFWPGEGCGFAVLAREEDARRWGARVYAVLRGWGVSSDGRGSITRPEQRGQALAVRRAYARAGYGSDTVGLFEGHGTGTAVGDAIELATLTEARRSADPAASPAVIGSIKANIGHTKAAAGIAGLLKAIMAVHERTLPPVTGCDTPHELLTGTDPQLRVLREPEAWAPELLPRAGISAMGFGGVNTHLTLEGTPTPRRSVPMARQRVLARTPQSAEIIPFAAPDLRVLAEDIDRLRAQTEHLSFGSLRDLAILRCSTTRAGQPVRAAIVADTPFRLDDQLDRLRSWLNAGHTRIDAAAGVFFGQPQRIPRIGFLFPGQAAPVYLGGGVLRRRFEQLAELYPDAPGSAVGDRTDTALAQPSIVRAALAGAAALTELGIHADAVLGHSIGELAALCWAGATAPHSAVDLAAVRGRATAEHSAKGGAMAELAADEDVVARLVDDLPVTIAALNAPDRIVLAGAAPAIEAACIRARARGFRATRLPVRHAFHSPLVAEVARQFATDLAGVAFAPVRPGMISTVLGGELPPNINLAAYLAGQITSPVRFSAALHQLADRCDLLLEVGPGALLTGLATAQVDLPVVATDCGGEDIRGFLTAVAAAHVHGAEVALAGLAAGRVQRTADPLRRPGFLANPCELVPADLPGESAPILLPTPRSAPEESTVDTAGDPFTVVRALVAKHVELPVDSLEPTHRMLADLRLNSITVAELAGLAARALGVAPPAVPTDLADASLAEFAEVLAQQPPADAELDTPPPGVAPWVRTFGVRWQSIAAATRVPEITWTVLAEDGDLLAPALAAAFPNTAGTPGFLIHTRGARTHEAAHWLVDAVQQAIQTPARIAILHHGEAGGLGRSLALEQPGRPVRLIEIPAAPSAQVLALAQAEAAQGHGFAERRIDQAGHLTEPVLRPHPAGRVPKAPPLTGNDVLLVPGGGRGIGAESALALVADNDAAVAVLGRADPAEHPEVALTLDRLRAGGRRVRYLRADVTDADAVKHAIDEIGTDLGPVTAVLHAAGANRPCGLSTLDAPAVSATLAPKVDGLRNILDAVEPGCLRLVIGYGSIIGRIGMAGQADYALANDWLGLEIAAAAERLPGCRFLNIEWSVWSEIGMGARLGSVTALATAGVDAMPPQTATRVLRELLATPGEATSVVVTGRFGFPPTASTGARELPLTRFLERPRVHYPAVELVCDSDLTVPSDPYLADHALAGTCLLPGVLGLEAMAQAATGLRGGEVTGFTGVELTRPVTVPSDGGRVLRVAALDQPDGRIEVVVRADDTAYAVDHFRALLTVAPELQPHQGFEPAPTAGPPVELDLGRDVYDRLLFHHDNLRRVRAYRELRARRCVVEIDARPGDTWFGEFQPQHLLLGDPGARDAFIHALQACVPHRRCLPERIDRITRHRPLAGRLIVDAVETGRDADTITVDLVVRERSGAICETWTGLSLRAIGPLDTQSPWPAALLGPYLERRLDDLLGLGRIGLGVATGDRAPSGLAAAARAAGRDLDLRHRADGKPLAPGTEISLAHQGDLTLAVVADNPLGCDLEAVRPRTREAWTDLLGPDRLRVAEQLAEDLDTAATRLWCVLECTRKIGRTPGIPLLRSTIDDWALFTVDGHRCATTLLRVRGIDHPLICAVLEPEAP
ncbi:MULTISPECIES: SDR family NAD(P)-dependent oxidoreductase [unclassified Crossiella]|uniref:type I polyketide synthase n=1 Tax=unclassified Crossiella TaxID=2620835 RepID=UPI00200048A9|nr:MULTISPECIES: type I polyketide synthase [unclassified Crossiella]MCK2244575.1 type I polyketide synthase [Crossiella sp. S99.2]MCK2258206.1 type I polyketide synthase [Crossiella sp. S99.1]